jgi:UDP-N-acetylmuramyl pentapeptide phosphotransferase/UDP-N-acetylglucosamine-1-phosphate transferase
MSPIASLATQTVFAFMDEHLLHYIQLDIYHLGRILLALITSFALAFVLIPPTIKLARKIDILDHPGLRRSHSVSTPRLGGIAIFFGVLFSLSLWMPSNLDINIFYVFAALITIFITGIKDDINSIGPWVKLIGQLIAAGIITFLADVQISNFYGIAGIHEIPMLVSYVISIFTIIVIINSFNLIDGINGLSASITILVSLVLGTWFYLIEAYAMSTISFALLGATLAFLYFNWSPAKIFMGDAGSLSCGLLVAFLILEFLALQEELAATSIYAIEGVPIVAMSILLLPLLDTLRVFTIRIFSGRSPLSPDRNHIHHVLIDAGYTHSQATGILVFTNAVFVLLAFGFNFVGNLYLLVIVLVFLGACALYFHYLISKKKVSYKSKQG